MDPTRQPDGLAGLLEDVLAADGPSPELLARYAEDPGRLSAEERSVVEAAAARSPAVADQLRVLESFDLARLEPSQVPAPADARQRTCCLPFGARIVSPFQGFVP